MRAFRPSHFGQSDEHDEAQQFKEVRLETYAERAEAGLPLFELPIPENLIPRRPEVAQG